MAAGVVVVEEAPKPSLNETSTGGTLLPSTISSCIGLSFAIFLGLLPRSSISLVSSLQSRNRALSLKLIQAEEQLGQMKSRRKEDSKANARVVEIFASHRNGWQQEERRLLQQIETSAEEIAHLKARVNHLEKSEAELRICVDKLQREVEEREEMINFMSRRTNEDDDGEEAFVVRSVEKLQVKDPEVLAAGFYASQIRASYSRCLEAEENGEFHSDFLESSQMRISQCLDPVREDCFMDGDEDGDGDRDESGFLFEHQNGHSPDFFPSASMVSGDRTCHWQDVRCDYLESSYQSKHFVARRESPWKIDGELMGVPSKLKLLEQELMNLEKIDKGEFSKISSLLRKQAKRYQALAGKIDDLCRKLRANDPSEPTLSLEFRTQYQTEILIEAHRLQQRATETGQKLKALQTEAVKSNIKMGNELESHTKSTVRKSLDSTRNKLREIQRNLEVWLARIMGDLEGILARDGASRVRDYYIPRYPFDH